MSKVLITTVPFGEKNRLPLEMLEESGIDYLINPFNRKITDCKSIELNDVSLDIEAGKIEYPNLKLEKGKIYVVSGPSGVGKSLLLTLLTGQIQPHSGEIKFSDGINENEFDLCKLDYRIMRQKDFLFSGTVAENIIFYDFLDLQREQLLAKLFAQLNLEKKFQV